MGNTILMLCIVVGVLRTFGVEFDVLADGDNCLIFLHGESANSVIPGFAAQVLAESGQELTLERPVRTVEEVRFGRSAPVNLGGNRGWTMVRDYLSVLSGGLSSHRYLREPKFAKEWLTGVAMCELSLARGIPVLQAWASSVLRTTGFRGNVRRDPYKDYFCQGAWLAGLDERVEVGLETRQSFERAFGLTVEDQVVLEDSFSGLPGGRYELVEFHGLASWPPGVTNSYLDVV